MKYFIDFEATQFTNEIIEIGCINEYGDVFHSYVKAKKKLTSFITNLTGITQDVINEVPSTDEVFENFFEWLNKFNNEEEMCFFCYGDTDLTFIKKNLQNTKSYKARIALSLLGMNLFNYATKVQEKLELSKSISLIKLYHYYIDAEAEQKHCALGDRINYFHIFDIKEKYGEFRLYWTIDDGIATNAEKEQIEELAQQARFDLLSACMLCGDHAKYKYINVPVCEECDNNLFKRRKEK